LKQQLAAYFSSPRNAIRVFAVVLLAAGTYGSLMRQPDNAAAGKTDDVATTFATPIGQSTPRVKVAAGTSFALETEDKGVKSMASFVLTAEGADSVKLDGTVQCGAMPAAHQVVVARLGQQARVSAAPGCELNVLVAEAAKTAVP
jgi:hypothetical protein